MEAQKLGLNGKTDAAKWKWDWTIVACVRLHSADKTQWKSEGGGGGKTWAQFQRMKVFIGRSSKDNREFGRLAYLAGDTGESGSHYNVYVSLHTSILGQEGNQSLE